MSRLKLCLLIARVSEHSRHGSRSRNNRPKGKFANAHAGFKKLIETVRKQFGMEATGNWHSTLTQAEQIVHEILCNKRHH